jgi:hypothetical protein
MLTKLLASGRYLMVVPVIGCLLLTLAVVIKLLPCSTMAVVSPWSLSPLPAL